MLDVLSMMEIIGEAKLVNNMKNIHTNYMNLMRENHLLVVDKEVPLEGYSHTYDEIVNRKRELL